MLQRQRRTKKGMLKRERHTWLKTNLGTDHWNQDWLLGRLARWLAGSLARWLASRTRGLAGSLARWLARWLNGSLTDPGLGGQRRAPGEDQALQEVPRMVDVPGDDALQGVHELSVGQLLHRLVASENKILARIDEVVTSFNDVLKTGLGEVPAKYEVSLSDWFSSFDIQVSGRNFPKHLLSANANIELFKLTQNELLRRFWKLPFDLEL